MGEGPVLARGAETDRGGESRGGAGARVEPVGAHAGPVRLPDGAGPGH